VAFRVACEARRAARPPSGVGLFLAPDARPLPAVGRIPVRARALNSMRRVCRDKCERGSHGLCHRRGRHSDLFKGLGIGPAGRLLPRPAADRGRVGSATETGGRQRLQGRGPDRRGADARTSRGRATTSTHMLTTWPRSSRLSTSATSSWSDTRRVGERSHAISAGTARVVSPGPSCSARYPR
jgi:hypothetical protein